MATKTVSKTGKKKNWYSIIAPKVFNEMEVGQTLVVDPQSMVGKTISSSLMTFTKSMRKQNITVKLKVKEVRDNKAYSDIVSYSMNPSAIKRLVRRRRDKVDDSFVCKTKDGKMVRVKPMVLTRSNASNPKLASIRHAIRYMFATRVMNMTYGQFVEQVLNDRLVKEVKKTVSYIYPARMISIRSFKLEENPKTKPTPITVLDKKVYDWAASKSEDKSAKPAEGKSTPEVHDTEEVKESSESEEKDENKQDDE